MAAATATATAGASALGLLPGRASGPLLRRCDSLDSCHESLPQLLAQLIVVAPSIKISAVFHVHNLHRLLALSLADRVIPILLKVEVARLPKRTIRWRWR